MLCLRGERGSRPETELRKGCLLAGLELLKPEACELLPASALLCPTAAQERSSVPITTVGGALFAQAGLTRGVLCS